MIDFEKIVQLCSLRTFNKSCAWNVVKCYFPNCSFIKNNFKSKNAGYDIYDVLDPEDNYTNQYVCDLDTRLELNFSNGDSKNVWIGE